MKTLYETCLSRISTAVDDLAMPNLALAKTMLLEKEREQEHTQVHIEQQRQDALNAGQQAAINMFMRHGVQAAAFEPVIGIKPVIEQLANLNKGNHDD